MAGTEELGGFDERVICGPVRLRAADIRNETAGVPETLLNGAAGPYGATRYATAH